MAHTDTRYYYNRVQRQMGDAKKTAEFIRLFMAPGVTHCAGGDAANFVCRTEF